MLGHGVMVPYKWASTIKLGAHFHNSVQIGAHPDMTLDVARTYNFNDHFGGQSVGVGFCVCHTDAADKSVRVLTGFLCGFQP